MDKKTLEKFQSEMAQGGVIDISKLSEYREKEEWYKGRAKAAGKAEEVVTIARSMLVEHPDIGVEKALSLAEEFHTKAYDRVQVMMEGFLDADEPGKSDLI